MTSNVQECTSTRNVTPLVEVRNEEVGLSFGYVHGDLSYCVCGIDEAIDIVLAT
jgi:hypothetical protein